MLKIALTGASGLIGSRIIELLNNDFKFIDLPQEKLDITDKEKTYRIIGDLDFDIFLHLAAYTDVDGAETNQETAYKINVDGTRNVFEVVKQKGKKFIYISTGFVFDGENPPYDETSKPIPLSVYAKTKWQGEEIVKSDSMIVRIEYPYRANYQLKNDFVAAIKNRLSANQTVFSVEDIFITPTFIDDITYSIKYLINNFSNEIYHVVGNDSLSPLTAANLIADVFNLDKALIQPVSAEKYFTNRATRPKQAIIKSIKNNFYKMKTFEEGISIIKSQLDNNKSL